MFHGSERPVQLPPIYLVSCVKEKKSTAAEAKDLYESTLFEKASRVARSRGDEWFILSAKHGLLDPEAVIDPYDVSLHDFTKAERDEWASDVFDDLDSELPAEASVVVLAGTVYRDQLVPKLTDAGYDVSVPMAGKPMGHQLGWLNDQIADIERQNDLDRFYSLLNRLASGSVGRVEFADAHGRLDWPAKGVYFVFEPGEYRDSDPDERRVVRVGTHGVSTGASTSLWNRLRAHRGTESGYGNHRSSIFRLHVGEALMEREGLSVPTWASTTRPDTIPDPELELEAKVSDYIGRMEVLCVEVLDNAGPNSDRAYIERNTIGLLSGYHEPSDSPSEAWLGMDSTRPSITESGLWNVDHVTDEYDPRFLDVFERYVDATVGAVDPPEGRIAPTGPDDQLALTEFVDEQ